MGDGFEHFLMNAHLLVVEWAPVAEVATLRSVGAVDVVSSRADEPNPQSLALPQKSEAAFCEKKKIAVHLPNCGPKWHLTPATPIPRKPYYGS